MIHLKPKGANPKDFERMLVIQNTLNARIDPDWLKANRAWTRAIWVEAAEGIEHYGWKWWKQFDRNLPQARIELADIWHFILSDALVGVAGNVEAAAVQISVQLDDLGSQFNILGEKFYVGELTTEQLWDKFAGLAALGHVFLPAFDQLMARCDMSWAQLGKLYVAKNVLNVFRQDNGYKQGQYVKDWLGEEDNAYLERMMDKFPTAMPEELNALLVMRYAEVMLG